MGPKNFPEGASHHLGAARLIKSFDQTFSKVWLPAGPPEVRPVLIILILSVVGFVSYLVIETIVLNRRLRSIPLRICVTGTRGKSSVVRMIASVLREEGKQVLAKTTGTKASYILPGGEEVVVRRRGVVSIIEQKKLVKKAFRLNVECLVAEIMSIHPENHVIEAQRLLKPHIVVLTNVRRDHTGAMCERVRARSPYTPATWWPTPKDHRSVKNSSQKNRTFIDTIIEEIAAVYASDIAEESTLFIPGEENNDIFEKAVKHAGGKLIPVKKGLPARIAPEMKQHFFPDNISLVHAVGKHLAIDKNTIINGLRKTAYDSGEFKVWLTKSEETKKTYYTANAFAANDPESTFHIISELHKQLPVSPGNLIGLLNLRADRGDRTLQWLETLREGGSDHFKQLYLTGTHARAVGRKLKNAVVLQHKEPEKIMAAITRNIVEDEAVIFGFGNIKGAGALLVEHWKKTGVEYGL